MIFLFFGTSLALLEAELAPFKDLEEIDNIWDFRKHKLPLFLKKRTKDGCFSRPAETEPYMEALIFCPNLGIPLHLLFGTKS